MVENTGISWGDCSIDLSFPKPRLSSVLLIDQNIQDFQSVLLRMVANELESSRPVHWIDGGMSFDPSPLLPLLRMRNCDTLNPLRSFHISRGFTAHQTVSIVKRLADEAKLSPPPDRIINGRLIIISEVSRMFMDSQLKKPEGRSLLTETLERCRALSKDSESLVIITSSRNSSPPLSKDMRHILRRFSDDTLRISNLLSKNRDRSFVRKKLHLLSIDKEVIWANLPVGQTSLLEFRHNQESRLDCLIEPLARSSSLQPNGESIAVAARIANRV